MIPKLLFLGRKTVAWRLLWTRQFQERNPARSQHLRGCSSVVEHVLRMHEVLGSIPSISICFLGAFLLDMVLEIIFHPHLQGCVVAWGASVAHVLLKLLQTVKHCLLQQLSRPRCLSDTTFAGNRPQLFHAWPQPRQVPTNLLEQAKMKGNINKQE